MLRILFRLGVGLAAILFASFVADSLLQLTEKATEIVVPVESLEKLAALEEQSDESEPLVDPARVAQSQPAVDESRASSPPTDPPPSNSPPLEPPAVAPIPDPLPAEEPSATRIAANTATKDYDAKESEVKESMEEAKETSVGVARVFNTVDAGQLASFGGAASNASAVDGDVGAGRSPVWDVQLVGAETSRQVKLPTGFVLVAVRLQGADVELVPLGGQLPPRPLTDDEFIKQHPAHASRQGIRLAGSALSPWREKLMNYDVQGGWQAWLLVDATTHTLWMKRLDDEIRRQGRSWEQLARVSSSLDMRRRGTATSGAMRIDKLTWKN
ncbi:MAG: hypothetical protein U0939_12140 [Pirellulales bacterium]